MSDKLAGGIKAGRTSVSIPIELRKSADSTELTGIVFGGVTASYWRQGGVRTAITPVTLTGPSAAYSSGGFVEVDATNMAGVYRFDVPDAAFATGADWVVVSLKVSTAFVQTFMFPLETKGAADLNDIATGAAMTLTGAYDAAKTAGTSTLTDAQVWSYATRLLTAGTNIVLTKGTGLLGLNDIAAGAAMTLTGAYDAAKTAGTSTLTDAQVWSYATRLLTAGTNIVLAKGTGLTGLNDIAAGAAMTLTGAYDAAKTAGTSTLTDAQVWSYATRILTAGTNIVLTKGTGLLGLNDIAAGAAMTLTGAYDAAKSAPPTADSIATLVSSTLAAAHGVGSWQTGSGGGGGGLSGPSAITVTFHDASGDPVPNVEFTVLGQGSARAGSNGVATFSLPDGDYTIAAAITSRVVFANTSIHVAGTTAQTITGTSVAITPPADPTLCRVEAYLSGPAAAIAQVIFELLPANLPAASAGRIFAGRRVTATAVDGHLSIDLFRGQTYRLHSQDLRFTCEKITLDGATFDLSTAVNASVN